MAIDADILRAMAAAGASVEVIIAAVEADALKDQARRDARRENNAERQRRFKAKRKGRTSGNGGNALPGVTPPIEEIIPPVSSDEETSAARSSKSGKPEKPDDVDPQTWRDFTKHRAKLKADVSETAIAGIRREAEKAGWTMNAALAESVTRGWRAFKADWVAEQKSTGPPSVDPMIASILSRHSEHAQ